MRITRIELVGFKRMRLNGFNSICIDFDAPIQQILGSNGSGKSSCLAELNPLPADHRDFEPNGKKHIWITHKGSTYECISDFSEGNKHTLIKDGVVINKLSNPRVQATLIEKEFNYTKQIRDLLLGKVKFTSMDPSQRRDWFTQLSDVNYDYAIHIYIRIKDRLRDVTGSLREYKRRLSLESAKLLKEEEITKLKEETKLLHSEISELLDKRENPKIGLDEVINQQTTTLNKIQSLSRDILKTSIEQPILVDSIDELAEAIVEVQKQMASCDALIEKNTKDHTTVEREVRLLKNSGLDGLEQLDDKLNELNNLVKERKKKLTTEYIFTDPHNARIGLDSIKDDLNDIGSSIPINENKSINQAKLSDLRNNLDLLHNSKSVHQEQLNKLHATKLHLEDHKGKEKIECPKCNHAWKLGYDETLYQQTLESIAQSVSLIKEIEVRQAECNRDIQYIMDYAAIYRRYTQLTTSRPDLVPLWDYIASKGILTDNPRKIQTLLNRVNESILLQCELTDLTTEIVKLNQVKDLTENTSLENLSQANERMDIYSLEINRITKEKLLLRLREVELKHYLSKLKEVYLKSSELESLLTTKDDLDEITVKAISFNVISDAIKSRQSILAAKEDILSEINNHANLIYDLTNQITTLTTDQEALTLLVDQISPKEGLIAQGLMGFMTNFVNRVNKVISKVWTYPLIIHPCSLESQEKATLDYKFPFLVVDESNTIADVSMASTGMCEIINLAFIIVAMHCLGLKDYPVLIDEFSATFDEAHRTSAVELIKNLLDQYSFSQLFIVSHYFTLHGALTNAQVCVLNSENLSITTQVNEHVTFT